MASWTLTELERAIRSSWDAQTCDPSEEGGWRQDNPARGQCVATAALLHDLLGGQLLIAKVYADGVHRAHHGWNRLDSGLEIDLTREQFGPGETLGPAEVVERPPGRPLRIQAQYELLRERVLRRLDSQLLVSQQGSAAAAESR